MTPEQFVFWLRGYFASGNPGDFTRGDWRTVADVLAQVAAFRVAAARRAELPLPAPLPPGYPPITPFPPLQQADGGVHINTRDSHAD